MLKIGTQIAYIPSHANGDITHKDVEFGFVTSTRNDAAFCRYWRKRHLGQLRTTANSELTPITNLVEYDSVSQSVIDQTLELIADQ